MLKWVGHKGIGQWLDIDDSTMLAGFNKKIRKIRIKRIVRKLNKEQTK